MKELALKGLCRVWLCITELYSTVVILPIFGAKLGFVISTGRKSEFNTLTSAIIR